MEKKSKRWQGELKQAITASTVGNILEWYDFALYGYVAPYIGPLFFPSHDPVASTIALGNGPVCRNSSDGCRVDAKEQGLGVGTCLLYGHLAGNRALEHWALRGDRFQAA